jgi:hypothetical protein
MRIFETAPGPSFNSIMASAKAMYLFGMTFEMNRLGML